MLLNSVAALIQTSATQARTGASVSLVGVSPFHHGRKLHSSFDGPSLSLQLL
jgi:hypothetical protein